MDKLDFLINKSLDCDDKNCYSQINYISKTYRFIYLNRKKLHFSNKKWIYLIGAYNDSKKAKQYLINNVVENEIKCRNTIKYINLLNHFVEKHYDSKELQTICKLLCIIN